MCITTWPDAEKYPIVVTGDCFGARITSMQVNVCVGSEGGYICARKSMDIFGSEPWCSQACALELAGRNSVGIEKKIHAPNRHHTSIHGIHWYHEDLLLEECAGFELTRSCVGLLSAVIDARTIDLERIGEAELRKTGLYDFHVHNGAKMVPFAGYAMPLSYGSVGQVASHNHVRTSAGLFDVGHMVQSNFRGATAAAFLEWLTPSSLNLLSPYSSTLSVILNENGGIIDDTVITKHSENAFYVVTNAGRRDRDLAWFRQKLDEWNSSERAKDGKVEHEVLEDWGLVALQGPQAAEYLQKFTSFDLAKLTFGKSAHVTIGGFTLHVARGGYTGEDGFEISIPPSQTVEVTQLLSQSPVQLAGLGARDSLRLEAGMCLYGNDLDEDTSPVEAGLSWVIGKDRKESGDFIGADGVRKHLKDGPPRRRVGLVVEGAPARQGAQIFAPSGKDVIGKVTSGIPSPTLNKNIAMGYVLSGWHKKGTEVEVDVRNKLRKAVVTPMPFIKPNYWRG